MINNGLNLLEVNAYWQKIVLGFIIIFAIALDVYRTAQASASGKLRFCLMKTKSACCCAWADFSGKRALTWAKKYLK